jgi:hypothetical protein
MKKTVLTAICLFLMLPALAAAQEYSFGAKGGVVFGSVPAFTDPSSGDSVDVGRRVGLTGGGFGTVTFGSGLGVQLEVLYTQKGLKYTLDDSESKVFLNYLEFPLLARYARAVGSTKVYAFGGPSANFNVQAIEEAPDGDRNDVGDDYKMFELSMVVGAGVQVGHFEVEGRWNQGVTGVSETDSGYHTRSFMFMFGARF